jgi:nucleotide-binding universal stress UspA family protein
MYDKILLTLDGSELARAAIPHAAQLAGHTDTEVTLLTVLETEAALAVRVVAESADEIYEGQDVSTEELAHDAHEMRRIAAQEELQHAEEQLRASGVANVQQALVDGLAGNAIVDYAQEAGAGAIVMATRGRSGLGREVVGSVAEYVLRHAGPAAVVLVGPRSSSR